jgi:alpha-amylase
MGYQALEWSRTANIYEVNLRQYTPEGSFEAFAKEMPRLRDMGVDVLWFMPITPISMVKRLGSLGSYYACSDYEATNPEFGSIDDFRILVYKAHQLGFKVIIDWVANHTGWDHRWTREHPDFYKKDFNGNFYDSNGWEDVIDLNFDNGDMRQKLIAAMKFWVDLADIDGFRCDMAMLVPLDFWIEARIMLDADKKLFWLAECEDAPYFTVFDAAYAWKFLHKMEDYWKKTTDIPGLDEVLGGYSRVFPQTTVYLLFTSNHDENSHTGTEYERMGDAAKPFAVLCCTWNGIPLIYSGQEMPNVKRLKFFDRDPITWTGDYALHDFYRTLLNLRKRNPALRAGDNAVTSYRLQTNQQERCFAFLRRNGADEVLVILNLSSVQQTLTLASPELEGIFKNCFTKETFNVSADLPFELSPWDFRVFEK